MNSKPTITGDDKEFVVIAQVVNSHVGESGDNLLLRGQFGALLELEVTNGSRESKVSVDTAKVDKAAGGTNTSLLALGDINKVLREMIAAGEEARFNLPSFWGLWSKERGLARPLTPSTERESPAFA